MARGGVRIRRRWSWWPFGGSARRKAWERRIPEAKIGLWGGTQSGKTTMLAALQIAVARAGGSHGWVMAGVDDESSEFLKRHTHTLASERRFPTANSFEAYNKLAWHFMAPNDSDSRRRPKRFQLQLIDATGDHFSAAGTAHTNPVGALGYDDDVLDAFEPTIERTVPEEVLDYLVSCDGLLYIFDPTAVERSYEFFHPTVERLTRRAIENDQSADGKLPQQLAVCIAKYDAPKVYELARDAGLTVRSYTNGVLLPEVPPELAEDFFDLICAPNSAARQVKATINNSFHRSRVRYFVCSSIGFGLDPRGMFTERDFANAEIGVDGMERIKYGVDPINVLQPILWLERSLRGRRK